MLITQMDVMRRMFGTEQLTGEQWLLALVPAIALFFLWELGKLVARRGAEPADATDGSRRGDGRLTRGGSVRRSTARRRPDTARRAETHVWTHWR